MRNFFFGVFVGLFLALVGAFAYWVVRVEVTYRKNAKEGLGPYAPYCIAVEGSWTYPVRRPQEYPLLAAEIWRRNGWRNGETSRLHSPSGATGGLSETAW
jgi:hypothetical protein